MVGLSDNALVAMSQEGNNKAFGELYRRHRVLIISMASRKLSNDLSSIEDAVQETFFNAWKAIKSFSFKAKFTTWLFHIGWNVMVSRYRATRKYPMYMIVTRDVAVDFRTGRQAPEPCERLEEIDERYGQCAMIEDFIKCL